MPADHALLGPSSAHRWLVCTPSAMQEARLPDTSSEAAAEGTLAHSIVEYGLNQYKKGQAVLRRLPDSIKKQDPPGGMLEYCREFVDYVVGEFEMVKARHTDARLYSECRLDLTDWVPESFGTSDVIIVADDELTVMDFKYGKGVPVSAINNPQIRLYALGAYARYEILFDIHKARMVIYQPRLSSITEETLQIEDLLRWGRDVVIPAAKLAYEGKGEYHPSDGACRFCRFAAQCAALADYNLKLAQYEFRSGPELTPEEIGEILTRVDQLTKWATAVKDFAQDQAVNHGVAYPGYKVVEGRSNRIIDGTPEEIAACLTKAGLEDIYKPVELKTLTQLEKDLGKTKIAKALGARICKPEGKPVLVPDSDPRDSIIISAEDDFKED